MRPTNIHNIYINRDILAALKASGIKENIWDVDRDTLDTVTFKECYADGHNASDQVAKEWLLANFKYMCPATIDSDVLVDKSGDYYRWSRLEFEPEKVKTTIDASVVLPILEASGLKFYKPGEHEDSWPCVDFTATLNEHGEWAQRLMDLEVEVHLEAVGWKLGRICGVLTPLGDSPHERVETWSVVPFDYEGEDEDEDEDDDSDDYEDGWHGILLTRVFLVDEKRDAEVLDAAGFRVLEHEDTGTVVAQVTFCGMSNEVNRARAGLLLAVDRGWPILTEKGWRRPVR